MLQLGLLIFLNDSDSGIENMCSLERELAAHLEKRYRIPHAPCKRKIGSK
jgi:hypothetical protein